MITQLKALEVDIKHSPVGIKVCEIVSGGKLLSPIMPTYWSRKIKKAKNWSTDLLIEGKAGIHAVRLPKKVSYQDITKVLSPQTVSEAIVVLRPTIRSRVIISKYAFRASKVCVETIILHPEVPEHTEAQVINRWEKQGVSVVLGKKNASLSLDAIGALYTKRTYFEEDLTVQRYTDGVVRVYSTPPLNRIEDLLKEKPIRIIQGTRFHKTLLGYLFVILELDPPTLFYDYVSPGKRLIASETIEDNDGILVMRRFLGSIYSRLLGKKERERLAIPNFRIAIAIVEPIGDVKATFGFFICNSIRIKKLIVDGSCFDEERKYTFREYWESKSVTVEFVIDKSSNE